MRKLLIPAVAVLAAMLATAASSQEKIFDVPFVPTPEEVVNTMLNLASVQKDDTLFDLGCGDGRIVITAVKRYGARGIGIDIDPDRIAECLENAKNAGVSDRVTFRQADLFETDFSDATVLTLYLLSTVNLRLRPVILNTLRPGVRVVSHDFSMGEWPADRTERLETENNHHTVYFWVVPANFSGVWEWKMTGAYEGNYTLRVSQLFQKASGVITSGGMSEPIKDVAVTGGLVQFTAPLKKAGGGTVMAKFSGNVMGDAFECSVVPEGGNAVNFSAIRDHSTKKALDAGAPDTR